MKDLYKIFKIFIFLELFILSKEDNCPNNEISINPLNDLCKNINDILEEESLEIDLEYLYYLASNNQGIIEKSNYRLEIFKLNDEKLQSQNIKKSKLYIPESCLTLMENNEQIKLDKTKGIVIIVYNYNKINQNNLPEIFFTIRHISPGSEYKIMNSKSFDFSLCHEDPILLDDQVNINNLKYDIDNDNPINIERIIYAKKLKVDLFDPHSDFLNNICFKFKSEHGTDVTLESRLEDYYQNITLCNESMNSHYLGFNYSETNKTITYRCAYGFYENEDEKLSYIDNIDSKMKMVFSNSNLKIITCFSELLNLKNIVKNFGGILCLLVFIIQVILYIHYCCQGTKPLQKKIDELFESEKFDLKIEQTQDNNNLGNTDDRFKKHPNFGINNIETDQNELKGDKEKKEEKEEKKEKEQKEQEEQNEQNGGNIINIFRKKKKKGTKKGAHPPRKKSKKIKDKDKDKNKNKKSQVELMVKDIDEIEEDNNKKSKDKKTNYSDKKEDKDKEEVASQISQIYEYNNYDKNEFTYERALKKDKRNFCQYYCFFLKISHVVLSVFCNCEDYNLFTIKLGLLLMTFPINLTFNIFFFTNKNIKSTYINKMSDISSLFSNFLNTFASSIFSTIFLIILKLLCLTHNSIRSLRKIKDVEQAKKKSVWLLRCIKLRICIYFILSLIFLLVFGYYIACFCVIFENTQIELIKSMFTSWILSLLYPFGIYFVSSIFRIMALRCKCKFFYRINKLLQLI